MTWNGDDRRKIDDRRDRDHDLLVEVHTMLMGMKDSHQKHIEDDEKHFGRLYRGQAKLFWCLGIGTGILMAVKFILK